MDHSETKYLPKVDHTPAELDEASKLLLKAADMIEQHGLMKNTLCENVIGDHGALCFRGALNFAATGHPTCWGDYWDRGSPRWTAELRMAEALGVTPHVLSPTVALSLPKWNNAPERTKQEVIAKMRAVALGL